MARVRYRDHENRDDAKNRIRYTIEKLNSYQAFGVVGEGIQNRSNREHTESQYQKRLTAVQIGKSANRMGRAHDDHLGDDDARGHKWSCRPPLAMGEHFTKLRQHGRIGKVKEEGAKKEH